MTEPSIEGLLTPDELEHVIRLQVFILRIQDAIAKANDEAARSGLRRIDGEPLRRIDHVTCALLGNDLSELLTIHNRAEMYIALNAREAVAA